MKRVMMFLFLGLILFCSDIINAHAKTVRTGPIDYELYEYAERTLLSQFSQADIGTPFLVPNNTGTSIIVFPLFQKDQVTETIVFHNDSSHLYYMVSSLYADQLNTLEGPMLFFMIDTDHYILNEDGVQEVLIHSWPTTEYNQWLEGLIEKCPIKINMFDNRGNIEKIIQNIPYYISVVYESTELNNKAIVMDKEIYVPLSLLVDIDQKIKVNWNSEDKQLIIDFSYSDMPDLAIQQIRYNVAEKYCTTVYNNNISTTSDDVPIIINGRSYVPIDLLEVYSVYSELAGQLNIVDK